MGWRMTPCRSPRRLGLLVEYEGTAYRGSQYQENGATVQAELEQAISSLTSESNRVAFAGRTDAGVHARGQVASFVTTSRHSAAVFPAALNHYLPEDIVVRSATELPTGFDVRSHARDRLYCYTIHNGPKRTALYRRFSWHIPQPLDQQTMERAATELLGEHDFAAFTRPLEARLRSTARRISLVRLRRRQELIRLEVEANAFLPHQIRRTVGALVAVGSGKMNTEAFRRLVHEPVPGAAALMAPPQGLCLVRVRYEKELFEHEEKNEDI